MAVLGGTNPPVTLNGATWVDLVAAPAAGKRREILGVNVRNPDSVDHTFSLRKFIAGAGHESFPDAVVLAGSGGQILQAPTVLDDTAKLQIKIEGAHTTTAPVADAAHLEEP